LARISEAKRIEEANHEAALAHFLECLGSLRDPRRPQGRRYPLETVVVTALMAMVAGCDDAEAMEYWASANEDWLATFLPMPHGAPSQDVYLRVFAMLEPTQFSLLFQQWVGLLRSKLPGGAKHIAIDGKTSRRSGSPANGMPPIHTVSAWLCDAGLVLGQAQVGAKSNEIKAVPELLRTLDLRGATVTLDAMGCQRAIAEQIVGGGGSWLLSVKLNQPMLRAEIIETFAAADDERVRAQDEEARPAVATFEETEKGHGRVEVRRVRVTDSLAWLQSRDAWKNIGFLVEVTRERTTLSTGATSTERAWFAGSGPLRSAREVAGLVRRHWSIENELHWVLDMAFDEDQARHRAGNVAANMTTLRHWALSAIRQDATRKLGVANSRKLAGFDRSYLLKVVMGGFGTEPPPAG